MHGLEIAVLTFCSENPVAGSIDLLGSFHFLSKYIST